MKKMSINLGIQFLSIIQDLSEKIEIVLTIMNRPINLPNIHQPIQKQKQFTALIRTVLYHSFKTSIKIFKIRV